MGSVVDQLMFDVNRARKASENKNNLLMNYLEPNASANIPGKRAGIGYGKANTPYLRDPETREYYDVNKAIEEGMEYEFPEDELGRRLNLFGRQMTGMEQRQMRQYQEQFAGRTGGRMSSARGGAEVGGQGALARSVGVGQIMTQAFNQELQQRQMALNAYIQKYGIDKQAEAAMAQLDAQREQASAGMFGDIFGSLALLPFLFSSSTGGSSAGTLEGAYGADYMGGYGDYA